MLFAKNRMGYLQLCELLSQAWLTNQYKAAPNPPNGCRR
jgi:DNA polymerase-3 subunit alpha